MSANSKIEWTDATWNPIRARLKQDVEIPLSGTKFKIVPAGKWGYHCERISPGCQHCYACTMNGRTLPAWGTGLDYTVPNREKVEIFLDEKELLKPLSWRKPKTIFPCSMTDALADFVPDEFIDRMFAVAALCCPPGCTRRFNLEQFPLHTYLFLTKRAGRMREYFAGLTTRREGCLPDRILDACHAMLRQRPDDSRNLSWDLPAWPLPNVWLGVSVENQQYADERIPMLLQTPAAVRWVSAEPLLGPIQLNWMLHHYPDNHPFKLKAGIDWVVVGGESGPGARPCDVAWIRSIVQQCKAAGVACFVKQLGANAEDVEGCGDCDPCLVGQRCPYVKNRFRLSLKDRKGGDPEEWPEDLRVRETPEVR